MKLRTLAALALAASALGLALPASAAPQKPMGLRFETAFTPIDTFNVDASGVRPQGDIRVGYDLPMGLTPIIGLGFRTNTNNQFDEDDNQTSSSSETDVVLDVELRYYLQQHKKGLQPFVFGEWNTTIVSFGTENGDGDPVNEAEDVFNGDEQSFWELNAGLGLEYKFSQSFAIGGKWGLGLAFRATEIAEEDGTEFGSNTSETTFGTSTSLYAAFRL